MYLNQRKLLYLPSENNYLDDQIDFNFREVFIDVEKNLKIKAWLIENDLLNFKSGERIGFIVKSGCDYISPISHPSNISVGICASAIGNSSVTYKSAVFKDDSEFASAQGFFTHVYVNRKTQRPWPISKEFRQKLNDIFKP